MGLELPSRVQHQLFDIAEPLKNKLNTARWIAPHNIHLTLKFLGAVPEEKVGSINNALESAANRFRKFYFTLGELGGFPSKKRARVLWVGVHHGAEELVALSKAIDNELVPLGFEAEDKLFKPHITLARLKTPIPIEDAIAEVKVDKFLGTVVNVDSITLFRSHLTRVGAEYEALKQISLPG
ncbi:MAG: RNA 2',3'-cyclic phosphodiesterase [Actinomycetota bacterium]|nr:RNA 2',3'-cyclic phosphodiesterase [Actinomycetota bacterium]